LKLGGKARYVVQECDENWCQWGAVYERGKPCLDAPGAFDPITAYDRRKKLPVIHTQDRVA